MSQPVVLFLGHVTARTAQLAVAHGGRRVDHPIWGFASLRVAHPLQLGRAQLSTRPPVSASAGSLRDARRSCDDYPHASLLPDLARLDLLTTWSYLFLKKRN